MGKSWNPEKIKSQTEYFKSQRENPTGDFTEFVTRMYYCVYKACSLNDGKCCSAKEVKPYKVRDIIYENKDTDPNISHKSVIDDCVEHLKNMHYVRFKREPVNGWMIYLERPLDFLLEGEHEAYLRKYHITNNVYFLTES